MDKIKTFKHEFKSDVEFATLDALLSHDANISWCQSIRDTGKSFDARQKCNKAISLGFNCVWLRWERSELGVAIDSWKKQHKDYIEVKTKGMGQLNPPYKTLQKEGSECGITFCAVKDSDITKDIQISKLKYIVYDECVPINYRIRTRRDTEYNKLMDIYDSLVRISPNVKLILLCNVIDWFNPYTQAWQITPFEAGYIKVFIKQFDTINGKITRIIAFENLKPSAKMLERCANHAKMRFSTQEELDDYLTSCASREYSLIEACPDKSVPLSDLQFRRGKRYYSFRVYNGVYYFIETGKRDVDTDVFGYAKNSHLEGRHPEYGKVIEMLINKGKARFENGHVFNEILNGLADYRARTLL